MNIEMDLLRDAARSHRSEILPPYGKLMDKEGFEAICAICEIAGGSTLYVPSLKTIFKRCVELEMIGEYNGYNLEEIRKKYGFSRSYMDKVLKT